MPDDALNLDELERALTIVAKGRVYADQFDFDAAVEEIVNAQPRLIAIARAAQEWARAWETTRGRTFVGGEGRELIDARDEAEEALHRALRGETTP